MKNVLTYKEYQERVDWPFTKKIDHSLYIIDAFLAQYPNAIVSFSGGIDSTVLLHLVQMLKKDVRIVFMDTTNEFRDIIKFVKTIESVEILHPTTSFTKVVQTYGFPLISKKVAYMLDVLKHPTESNANSRRLFLTGLNSKGERNPFYILPDKYRFLIDAPFNFTNKCCDLLKKKPFSPLTKNGVLVGTLATESDFRKAAYISTGCINVAGRKAAPLSIWKKEEIWKFIRENHIPYCSVYDKGEASTGCAYCGFGLQFDPRRFERLKKLEPKRYQVMMNLKNNGITYYEAIRYSQGRVLKGFFDMY